MNTQSLYLMICVLIGFLIAHALKPLVRALVTSNVETKEQVIHGEVLRRIERLEAREVEELINIHKPAPFGYLATVNGQKLYVQTPGSTHDRDNLLKTLGLPSMKDGGAEK